jgi:hypothetical protein
MFTQSRYPGSVSQVSHWQWRDSTVSGMHVAVNIPMWPTAFFALHVLHT